MGEWFRNWPSQAMAMAEKLKRGESVEFRPKGNSMTPLIKSDDLVTVVPIDRPLEKGDIVFCKVKGTYYVHLIKAIDGDRVQIGNNHGRINGWTSQVFGRVSLNGRGPVL